MESFAGLQFDGHFYANLVQGGLRLFSEIRFTATLNYTVADQNKLDTMFVGQPPVDILKKEASFAAERRFTNLFKEGCSPDELNQRMLSHIDSVLQDPAFSDWEGMAGVRLIGVSDMHVQLDPKTEKMISDIKAINSPPKPVQTGWKCICGTVNNGNFCTECGSKRPDRAPLYRCDKCGWEPSDPHDPPRFCPECGDSFDTNDIK